MNISQGTQNQIFDIKFKINKIDETANQFDFEPVMLINQLNFKERKNDIKEIPLYEYKFNQRLSEKRYCIGFKAEETNFTSCKFGNELTSKYYTYCNYCENQLGFKSAFFFNEKPNKRMRKYFKKDQFVYLAIFTNGTVKVGTCVESRKHKRQIEQDALLYCFVAKTKGEDSRKVEDLISKKLNITQFVRSGSKLKSISHKIDIEKSTRILQKYFTDTIKLLKTLNLEMEILEDLQIFNQTENSKIFYPERFEKIKNFNEELVLFGKFLGLRGKFLIFENNNQTLIIDKRELIGRYLEGEVSEWRYKVEELGSQMGLF